MLDSNQLLSVCLHELTRIQRESPLWAERHVGLYRDVLGHRMELRLQNNECKSTCEIDQHKRYPYMIRKKMEVVYRFANSIINFTFGGLIRVNPA